MTTENTILANLETINTRIKDACKRCDRKPEDIQLLLATKTVSADNIKVALHAGHTLIGENKVQEIRDKYEALCDTPHTTHFIGHLQTNKIKYILKHNVACVESIDRLKLARKLQNRLEYEDKHIDVLIQVNTSAEESKFGIAPEQAIDFTRKVAQYDRLHIRGLMTIGLFSDDMKKVRECFKLLKNIQKKLISADIPNVEMKELSMGMSKDLEIAIEEGATIIRIGTAIFGERIYPDSYYWNETSNG